MSLPAARIAFYVATFGALALVLRTLIRGPVPLWIALCALTLYVTLVLAGVLVLRLRMFVDAICKGPKGKHAVALTFDDGPSPEHTPKVLELLKKADAKATFFVIGKKAEKYPEIIRAILEQGHSLGSHSYAHSRAFSLLSTNAVREDIKRSLDALEAITGSRPRLFRPPIGHTNPRIAKVIGELDLTVVGWSVRTLDGIRAASTERVTERAVRGLKDGAIVLLHDAAERDDFVPKSIEALPEILRALKKKKLRAVRLDAFLEET